MYLLVFILDINEANQKTQEQKNTSHNSARGKCWLIALDFMHAAKLKYSKHWSNTQTINAFCSCHAEVFYNERKTWDL